ncbi:nucleotidyltransferase family protein [Virgibacillus doumboii]|uniref:nucleotidyltransferase family protein n=1 Tax=Virgibacillus doumboii TaxID=2697503 RepID=UPI0013DEF879|nr:nucleotidyltransferase family protein [Virgibacillus doumboii]
MTAWKKILVSPFTSIIKTMEVVDQTALQFAVVVDREGKLLGTVTDGDIRRGILNGLPLESSIQKVMNSNPVYEYSGKNPYYYNEILERRNLQQLPIVDKNKRVCQIFFSNDLHKVKQKDNVVVLMAGGLGTRLRPLTNDTPKPMLNVGNKPILEQIIESFKSFGFSRFILTVNYKKEKIKDYFQDGSFLGVNISYIDENKRLGTAGALSLLNEQPDRPFFVMNGDLLTKINFEQLLDFHNENNSIATMCVREHEYQIPYGVIETDNHKLLSIEEKPVQSNFVNAGIYVLNPEVLEYVPKNCFYDMPDLFNQLMVNNKEVSAFPLREYWMDIGQIDDYEKANVEYSGVF